MNFTLIEQETALIAFEEFKAYIEASQFTDVDFFELIGHFIAVHPMVAQAFCFHTRDLLGESKDDINYGAIVIEVYRRTFFDAQSADKYGTRLFVGSFSIIARMLDMAKMPTEDALPDTQMTLLLKH